MGNFWTSDEDKNETKSPASHTTDIVTLLAELNANPSKDTREFEIIGRQEVNRQRLLESLEEVKDNLNERLDQVSEAFKQFETYQMVMEQMPLYVLTKKPIGGEDKANFSWNFQTIQYYDVYGADTDINDKMKDVLLSFFTSVIADIVMRYCGANALLFSAKKGTSGGMTLTTTTLIIEDALEISSTYSEKSGRSNDYKLNKKYDKKLHMYLTWLVSVLHHGTGSSDSRFSRLDYYNQVFSCIDINKYAFRDFVAFEILEKPRPPPREHICVLADCLVEMACGKKAARDICAGDIVRTANGSLTKVMCTVTQRIDDVIKMCNIGECCITPEHPIRNIGSDEWQMPYDMVQSVEMYVDQVNNFVLESGHCVIVDDVECITLGHMLSDPIVKHPVWGTQVVCDFLKSFPSHPDVVIENSLAVQYLLSNKLV
eukprot:475781_1